MLFFFPLIRSDRILTTDDYYSLVCSAMPVSGMLRFILQLMSSLDPSIISVFEVSEPNESAASFQLVRVYSRAYTANKQLWHSTCLLMGEWTVE